ncbi:hypothetical protein OROMI_009967 [Orobanche minor]
MNSKVASAIICVVLVVFLAEIHEVTAATCDSNNLISKCGGSSPSKPVCCAYVKGAKGSVCACSRDTSDLFASGTAKNAILSCKIKC